MLLLGDTRDVGFRKMQGRVTDDPRHAGKRVLLIEDSRVFSTLLTQGVRAAHGVDVVHCSSLSGVRAAVEADGPDFSLAVLDLNLPDAPNCEALDYVISRKIPAIVFTGSFNDRTRQEILDREVLGCLIKDEPDAIARLLDAVGSALSNAGSTIVVVDPSAASRERLVSDVRQGMFRVVQAESASDALELVAANEAIDLVIMDASTHDMTARAFLCGIAACCGDNAVPVIMTGDDDADGATAFLKAGGADYVRRSHGAGELMARVENAAGLRRRIRSLYRLASLDYLTNLYNRRYFFQLGPRMVDQCLRRGGATSIAILDIDHFKRLNDTYGHEIGDLALKAVSGRLRSLVGEEHLLSRLGGEEFGILFNETTVADAIDLCEYLRTEIAALTIDADGEELKLTVSMGLATIEGPESFDNYLNAADQFLYMAKYAGRNRIVSEMTVLKSMAS